MQKIHLQVIEKQALENLPGPGQYVPQSTFGRVGPKYSLSPRSALRDCKPLNAYLIFVSIVELNKSSALPGPG